MNHGTVIPANDCMDAGGRATQEAQAEAGMMMQWRIL
jgi:hypothetical protein